MEIHPIETGFFSTDGGAMFGIVSRKVWSKKYPVTDENRCPLAMRALLAEGNRHVVLLDTGVGQVKVPGMSYYRFHQLVEVRQALQSMGIQPEEVTDVVLSHMHFDHAGGTVYQDGEGHWHPSFPHAVYWVGEAQVTLSEQPSLWEADSYVPEITECLRAAGQLQVVTEDRTLFPGLRVRLFQGHTDDQLVSYLETERGTLVFTGDVIPMTTHVMPLCIAAVDNSAVISVSEKMRLLKEAVAGKQFLFFYHDAVNAAVRLKQVNGRISVAEAVRFD
jgi:glyoxylase-like metal-dependent hydrolase (beta-lactamase superfamily II)